MQNMSASGESDDSGVIPSLDIMFAVFSLCVGVSSIIMNFVVFAVYLKLDWKHPTYFLFINITLHDALSGFTGNCYIFIWILFVHILLLHDFPHDSKI